MEREILFRGKGEFTEKWIEGYYGKVGEKGYIFTGEVVANNHLNDYGGTCFGLERHAVDPATVGQYTGLTDRNGKQIFEGDIVEFFGMRGEIVQECGAFGVGCRKLIDYDLLESKIPYNNSAYFCNNDNFISLWELWWNYEQDDDPLFEVEIIGNVWDTPELLEVKK